MPRTTRRNFARAITVAAVTLPIAGTADLLSQTATVPQKGSSSLLAVAWTVVVRAEFERYLSLEEMKKVADDFGELLPVVEKLRDFKLTNADEPWFR